MMATACACVNLCVCARACMRMSVVMRKRGLWCYDQMRFLPLHPLSHAKVRQNDTLPRGSERGGVAGNSQCITALYLGIMLGVCKVNVHVLLLDFIPLKVS